MKEYDVEPTAETIDRAAQELRYYANQLEHLSKSLRKTKDFGYAAEATSLLCGMLINLRLDLLVTRPLRETMK